MGKRIEYSLFEETWIAARRDLPRRQLHAEFCARFGRTDVTVMNIVALCNRNGWKTGRTGCFEKGNTPANKGRKMPWTAGSARFRKGHVPHNWRGAGHEHINSRGYVMMIVEETNPWTGAATTTVYKHRYLWEQANGPVPPGHALKCLDGDKTNTDPSNWIAIPRAMMPRLVSRGQPHYDAASAELRPTLMALAQLEHAAREIKKK
jgi:hypothetical protein